MQIFLYWNLILILLLNKIGDIGAKYIGLGLSKLIKLISLTFNIFKKLKMK